MEQYTEIWQSEIGKKPKLTNYSQIKSEWGPANYEVANLDKGECCLTARLMLRQGSCQGLQGRNVCAKSVMK